MSIRVITVSEYIYGYTLLAACLIDGVALGVGILLLAIEIIYFVQTGGFYPWL